MRKTTLLLLSAMVLVLGSAGRPTMEPIRRHDVSAPGSAFACTSFAVYSDETLYGMNFDYPDVEVRFTINTVGDLRVFQMEFEQEDGWAPTVGMNSAGLFASCQMLFPEVEGAITTAGDELFTWQLYRSALHDFVTAEDVDRYLSDKRVVHWSVTLHDLIADPHGDAMVVEPGDGENVITRIDGDFIVMANFPNGDFVGQSYENVSGVGAKRYKVAYEHIQNHKDAFDVDQALETLEKAVSTGDWPTLCSMVFYPEQGEVFIALASDFSRIWRLSLEDQTIEPYRGLARVRGVQVDASGVVASELEAAADSGGGYWIYVAVVAVVLAGGACLLTIKKRERGCQEPRD